MRFPFLKSFHQLMVNVTTRSLDDGSLVAYIALKRENLSEKDIKVNYNGIPKASSRLQ